MNIKLLEIRDRLTFIPVMAIQVTGSDGWLLNRSGYNNYINYVLLVKLNSDVMCNIPDKWMDRTMKEAHEYILNNWDKIGNEDVIDVEYILGESTEKKISERYD